MERGAGTCRRYAAGDGIGRGISLDLARRRARQISGVRYDLSLDLTAKDMAAGSAVIRFDRVGNSGDLVLDFRGPTLGDLIVNGRPLSKAERIDGHLILPAALLKTGANVVSARFVTPIAASGASIIRYHDDKDGQTYLYTLLVPPTPICCSPASTSPTSRRGSAGR